MSESKLHSARRALFIEEILCVVLEYVAASRLRDENATLKHVSPMDTEASRSLARIARVCKAFTEPALDVLWRDLYDLEHLLKLLSAFKLKSERRGGQYFCLNGDVPDHEWRRLATYAKRVHRFEHSTRRFEVAVFERLVQLCKQGGPLLPSLRELRWRMDLAYLTPDVLLFVAPGLRLLTLHEDWIPAAYPVDRRPPRPELPLAMVRTLVDSAPGMEVLILPLLPLDGEAWEAFRRFCRLHTLSCFGQPTLSDPASVRPSFRALAAIPHLRTLDIVLGEYDLADRSDSLVFESLETLKLRMASSHPWMMRFFLAVSAPRLRSLSVTSCIMYDADDDPPILQASMGALASSLPRSLREVHLEYKSTNPVRRGFTFQVLLPLLQLPQLTTVSLGVDFVDPMAESQQTLTDDDISSVASAWPRLRALSISVCGLEFFGSELPSLRCLHAFARFCPDLRSLALPITPTLPISEFRHATDPDPDPAEPHAHALEKLSLQLLRYDDNDHRALDFVAAPGEVESIARTVYRLFPSLNLAACLSPLCGEPGLYADPAPWDGVVEAMASLQDPGGEDLEMPRARGTGDVWGDDGPGSGTDEVWTLSSPLPPLPFGDV